MSPQKSVKNHFNGAYRFNRKIFMNYGVIVEINDENYTRKKSCLSDSFEIFLILETLAIFEITNKLCSCEKAKSIGVFL